MARDDLEYLTLADFTPGIYSKHGVSVQLGRDGAAQVHDGRDHHTFGCYPDPDGGLRPLLRRVARYGVNADDTTRDTAGATTAWATIPTTRGVGTSDNGRRSKIGVIDAAVHEATRINALTYDAPPRSYDTAHGVARPDMVHIITSYREDPVPTATNASTRFPFLGRLVNRWHAFSLSEVDQATGDINVSALQYDPDALNGKPHRIIQQKASRVEEGTYDIGGSYPADADFASTASPYTYDSSILTQWRRHLHPVHDGWAAGSLAVGRSIPYPIDALSEVTLDRISLPGRLTVLACLQSHIPSMAADSTEEVMPNFFSGMGGPFGTYTPNDGWGYPFNPEQVLEGAETWIAAGNWTWSQVPWYLIEHQDRFVGVINTTFQGIFHQRLFDGLHIHNWDGPANQIRYTELNAVMRMWAPLDNMENTDPAHGYHYRYSELWKYIKTTGGTLVTQFNPGTPIGTAGAPASPDADIMGNNLVARIGCMFSWQNDLILVPIAGEGSIARGSMEDPTVIRSGSIVPTGGVTCHATQTPIGVVYGTTSGVVMWDGQGTKNISPQLDGWFWDCGEASETHKDGYRRKANASMGRFGYSAPFIFAPNNWVMDMRTGAWTRLTDPAESNSYPYMHYVTNGDGDVYAVRGCYDGTITGEAPLVENSYFMDCYQREGQRGWRWQWVSQPFQSSVQRSMKVSEVVIVAQGQGTIEVFLSGSDTDEQSVEFSFDSTNHPVRLAQMTDIDTTDLVVRVDARGQGTSENNAKSEAPTLHAIHFGSRSTHQINRD